MINKCKKYKIIEEYLGKRIEVDVHECWSSDGVEEAYVSCPKYNPIIRALGHKVNRLSIDDIHNVIFKEFLIAERSIAENRCIQHDNFENTRHFHIIVEYEGQEINITLMIKAGRKEVHIICPSTYFVSSVSMEDNKFRNKIIYEVEKCKELIDKGCVFPKPNKMSKVKKKIKSLF